MAENTAAASCSHLRTEKLEFLRVLIPSAFAKQRIPGKIAKSLQNEPQKRATLYSPHGKFWHVGISHEGDDMYLDDGWREFAEALHLRTGYFVLFQYRVNMVFSVKIFDNTMCLKDYARNSSKRLVRDLYEDTFQAVDVPCTEGEEIPKKFCLRHGLVSERELFIVSTTGKSWPVQFFLTFYDGKLKGFRDFVRDNGLRKGDRCTFQLVNKNTFLVHVMASAAEKKKYSPISLQNDFGLIEVSEFERVVSRCYLHNMYIPTGVRKAIGLVSDCGVILRNQEGRSWPVKFFIKSNGEGHLGLGWRKFQRENNLKEGDRCIFKLVEQNVLLVNVVLEESTDSLCNEMHTPTQLLKISNTKDCSSSSLVEKALTGVNNASGSLTSSVVEVPSIEVHNKLQSSINYMNSTGINKVQSIEAHKNLSSTYVEKASSTEAQKEVQSDNRSNSTGIKKVQIMKAPEAIQKKIVQNPTNGSKSTGIEKIPVNEQKKSSQVCVEKTPPTDATGFSSPSVVKEQTIIGLEELQNTIIDACFSSTEKVQSLQVPDEGQSNSSSVYVETTPPTEAQKKKAQNNNCLSSTSVENEQLVRVAEAQKKLISVCVEKAPCITDEKEMRQNNSNSSSATSIENIPTSEQKKSSSACFKKVPSANTQKEKVEMRKNNQRASLVEKRLDLQHKMGDWSSTRFPKVEKVVLPYNVHHNYMVLSKEFCKMAHLHSPCCLSLKDSEGKTWKIDYSPNNGKGNLRWKRFVDDKKLKEGDKCIFKLVSHGTLLVNIVRK